jgi:GT2 family glycosyltransferase
VLDSTLQRLYEFGLGDVEVIVCDDGSSPPLECPSLALFPRGRLLRNDISTGQAVARNTIATAATGTFILQLDDDSYPVAGNVSDLLALAARETSWVAFAIPFQEPVRQRLVNCHAFPPGTLLRAFVGCSALLNRQAFLRIGGYATWIGRTVEEDELCIRAFREGLHVLACDALTVQHDVTPDGRSLAGIEQRSFCNWLLTWTRYAPWVFIPVHIVRLTLRAFWILMRYGRSSAIVGVISAINRLPGAFADRSPLRMQQYRDYFRTPHALGIHRTGKLRAIS